MMKVVILGIIFGVILQRSRVNTFDKIGGFAMLKDFTVPKVMLTAIAFSAILLYVEVKLGMAGLHVKPLVIGGLVSGGIFFGIGMAVLGYCPGTLIVSTGEGALDALIGIIVGVVSGAFFTAVFPHIRAFLGPNLGKLQLLPDSTFLGGLTVSVFAILLVLLARKLNSLEK